MTTFGLIHGGFSTSWHWGPLRDELERRNHRVIAPELPISDPSADPDVYLDVAASALSVATEPVVLVGHSIAGWTTLRLPDRIPVAGIIYLGSCVNLPPGEYPGEPLPMIAADPADWVPDESGLITLSPEAARQYFFHDLDPAVADDQIAHLVRQGVAGIVGPSTKPTLPEVPAAYVKMADDHAVSDAWATWAATLLTEREARIIEGSHFPWLTRAEEVAGLFEEIVAGF